MHKRARRVGDEATRGRRHVKRTPAGRLGPAQLGGTLRASGSRLLRAPCGGATESAEGDNEGVGREVSRETAAQEPSHERKVQPCSGDHGQEPCMGTRRTAARRAPDIRRRSRGPEATRHTSAGRFRGPRNPCPNPDPSCSRNAPLQTAPIPRIGGVTKAVSPIHLASGTKGRFPTPDGYIGSHGSGVLSRLRNPGHE